ncbi:hypothetical protein QFZ75_003466 [Streptomyces sp. V3I8]|nr:hypothetical protein [Streptomyces sp. V3I8]
MFAEPCGSGGEERLTATAAVSRYVTSAVRHAFPGGDAAPTALATAVGALLAATKSKCAAATSVPTRPSAR